MAGHVLAEDGPEFLGDGLPEEVHAVRVEGCVGGGRWQGEGLVFCFVLFVGGIVCFCFVGRTECFFFCLVWGRV